MKRIIIVVFTLIFVQLVKSQTPALSRRTQICLDAITVRERDEICSGVNETDPNTLCVGACQDLVDDIIDNCDNEVC